MADAKRISKFYDGLQILLEHIQSWHGENAASSDFYFLINTVIAFPQKEAVASTKNIVQSSIFVIKGQSLRL